MDFPTLLAKENSDMYVAIQRVRELHKEEEMEVHGESCPSLDCQGCEPYLSMCALCLEDYPCPTIQALDGDTNE